MGLVSWWYDAKYGGAAVGFMSVGNFDNALEYVKKISTVERQEHVMVYGLFKHAVRCMNNKNPYFRVRKTHDIQEYNRFKALVGDFNGGTAMVYVNESGEVPSECMRGLIEGIVPEGNPVLTYLKALYQMNTSK